MEIEIMDTLFQKRNGLSRGNCWKLLGLALALGLSLGESAPAQRAAGYRGSRQGAGRTSRTDQATQNALEALEKIEAAATILLMDNLLQVTPPQPTELPKIQNVLETNKKFAGLFPKERKAYLYVLESLLAHYAGQHDEALEKAKRAYYTDPKNHDLSDLIIVLSLCYENYEEAKKALQARKAGSAVFGNAPPISPVRVKRGPREPNVPGRTVRRPPEPNSVPRPRPGMPPTQPGSRGPSSKWDQLLSPPSEQQSSRPGAPGVGSRNPYGNSARIPGRPGGTTIPGRMPPTNPRMNRMAGGQQSQQRYQTILQLPVDYMLSEQLGEVFDPMKLRSINGSYFLFTPGKGNILCALLWTSSGPHPQSRMPRMGGGRPMVGRPNTATYYRGEEDMYEGGYSRRPRSPMTTRPAASSQVREIPNVAFDLDTNTRQFRDLFLAHINEGKACFVGINYDSSIPEVKQILFEQPLPWSTCLKAEGVNTPQRSLPDNIAGALLLLVDTKGKTRYIGPVGGFLPQMLLEMELPRATSAMGEIPDIPVTSRPIPSGLAGMSNGRSSTKKGALGFLFGGRNKNIGSDQAVTATVSESPAEPNVPVRKKPVSPPPMISRKTPNVTLNGSNPQARNLLRAAQVQRKLTPISALRSCDQVLERWPNSREAQEAKVMIKSLLEHGRLPNDIKQQRKAQGKYIGED